MPVKIKFYPPPFFFILYVDDILTSVPKDQVNNVIEIFNSINKNLQFTYETEVNNIINFLDRTIIRNNHSVITNWYQKPTFTGRILHYKSNHPKHQKISMIYNLIDKSVILADKKFHSENIKLSKSVLYANEYPIDFVEKYVKKRLQKIKNDTFYTNVTPNNNNNQYNILPKIMIPHKKQIFDKLGALCRDLNFVPIAQMRDKLTYIINRGKDSTKKLDKPNEGPHVKTL